MYLFDTDTYSNFLRGNPRIVQRVAKAPAGSVYLCAVTPEEMLRGRLDYINQLRTRKDAKLPLAYDYLLDLVRELNRISILRYDDAANAVFQALSPQIKRAGSQDCRIAATAQVNGFIVVTSNITHFSKITSDYEDWNI